jgi:hypothetical protein
MDDLIDQLRDANPEPRPDALPIDPMWDRLARLNRSPGNRRLGPRILLSQVFGAFQVIFAIGITIVVVVFIGLSARGHTPTPSTSGGAATVCLLTPEPGAVAAVKSVLSDVQLLRQPVAAQDQTAAACTALAAIKMTPGLIPTDPAYKATPVDLRYVGPGILGGIVFMYALPGVPHAVAYRGVPADSSLARSEVQPSVCLITVHERQAVSSIPSGCTTLKALHAGPGVFGDAQIEGTATSVLAGVIRDGITALRVYDRGKLIKTVPVEHNIVQFIVDHNAAAAAHLRIKPVARATRSTAETLPPPARVGCGDRGVAGVGFTVFACDSGAASTKYAHPGELLVVRADGSFTGYPDAFSQADLLRKSATYGIVASHDDAIYRVTAAVLVPLVTKRQLELRIPGSPLLAAIDALTVTSSGDIFLRINYYASNRHGCANARIELSAARHLKLVSKSSTGQTCG